MNNEYLTIAEFAKAAGIPKQEVYSLRQDYASHFKRIDGINKVSILLLENYKDKDSITEVKNSFSQLPTDKPVDNKKENVETENIISFLQDQIIDLRQELKEKDKQLTDYHSRITSQIGRAHV